MILPMSIIRLFSRSRGKRNLLRRTVTILQRFGITARSFQQRLERFYQVTANLGCVPTFAITAVTLRRHPAPIRELHRRGVEFAVHGYIHTDYKTLPTEDQTSHFKKAIQTFQGCDVPYAGFRAPFLRANGHTAEVLSSLGFIYDSSHAIHWDVLDTTKYPATSRDAYDRLIDFYQPREAREYLSLPRPIDGFVEIPVSIPDDEAMVDRLGIKDATEVAQIWKAILKRTYDRGELFAVQLHPEFGTDPSVYYIAN